ncbi:MAG: FliH/SctL family protein [Thermacetogeniaceae bacterium]
MSKVIKATRLVVSFPRKISHQWSSSPATNAQREENGHKEHKVEFSGKEGEIIAAAAKRAEEILREARLKAEEIIAAARAEADRIIEEKKAEIEQLREEAFKTGYEEGFIAGQKALDEDREKMKQEAAAAMAKLEEERRNLVKEMEPKLLQLAVYLARQVVHAELKLFPEQIRNLVNAVLERATETSDIILKVPPGDYEEISNLLSEAGQKMIRIEVDNSIHKGCLLETPYGTLDGTVEGQLKEIAHELFEVLSG